MGFTKSPNEGPAFRVSLNEVAGRERFEGVSEAGGCGASEVVAKDLSGAFKRGPAFNAARQRVRGIEAAIVSFSYILCEG